MPVRRRAGSAGAGAGDDRVAQARRALQEQARAASPPLQVPAAARAPNRGEACVGWSSTT